MPIATACKFTNSEGLGPAWSPSGLKSFENTRILSDNLTAIRSPQALRLLELLRNILTRNSQCANEVCSKLMPLVTCLPLLHAVVTQCYVWRQNPRRLWSKAFVFMYVVRSGQIRKVYLKDPRKAQLTEWLSVVGFVQWLTPDPRELISAIP